ncbi:hypothetical protein KMU_11720 [Proteus vulgaris]|uniref:hypothetical protein n=1 Tax=Proteus vulgaris TaxID=585 RepID=UPI0025524C97|nr:hypothetical protein [Proteus vulgaris]GLX63131.1 hypothetical protein KMU_11720 [Proteus vulgaris]
MSLLQVFSQVLMLEAEVSDSALANIRKSADEILVEMKNIEQGVSGGITSFYNFVQEIHLNLGELPEDHDISISFNSDEMTSASVTIENSIQSIVKSALMGTQEFDKFLQEILVGMLGLSLNEPINIDLNISETQDKINSVTQSIDTLKDSMSVLNYQRELINNSGGDEAHILANLNAEYEAMEAQLSSLNGELNSLTEAEKKNKESKIVIDALIKQLGADYDTFITTMQTQGIEAAVKEAKAQRRLGDSVDETGKSYQKTTAKMKDYILNAIGAKDITGTLQKVFSASLDRAKEIESLDKLSKKIGIAAIDIDAFSGAMAEIGGTKEAAQADLTAMANAFNDTEDPIEQLLKTADKVKGMSFDGAQKELEKLGVVDEKTIELMMKGREELERTMGVQKQFSGINDESVESSIQLNAVMNKFDQLAAQLKNNFLDIIIPVLAKGITWFDKLVNFCIENKDFVIGFFSAIGSAVAIFYLPAMVSAAVATLATALPILAIAAVIGILATAFKLVYDDIMNFINGNDSMIGSILDQYPALKDVIMVVWAAWQTFVESLKIASSAIAEYFIAAWNFISESFNQFIMVLKAGINNIIEWGQSIISVFVFVSEAIVGVFSWMWEYIEKILGWVNEGIDSIKGIWQSAKSFLGMEDTEKEITVVQKVERKLSDEGNLNYTIPQPNPAIPYYNPVQDVNALNNGLTLSSTNSLNPMTSQMISNQSSVKNESNVQIGEIRIETQATDGPGVAKAINETLINEAAKEISEHYSSGGKS